MCAHTYASVCLAAPWPATGNLGWYGRSPLWCHFPFLSGYSQHSTGSGRELWELRAGSLAPSQEAGREREGERWWAYAVILQCWMSHLVYGKKRKITKIEELTGNSGNRTQYVAGRANVRPELLWIFINLNLCNVYVNYMATAPPSVYLSSPTITEGWSFYCGNFFPPTFHQKDIFTFHNILDSKQFI